MYLRYEDAVDATKAFNGVTKHRALSYKNHLLGNWVVYLNLESRDLRDTIEEMTEHEAQVLVDKIHLFWYREPHGGYLDGHERFIIDTDKRLVDIRLVKAEDIPKGD